VKPKAKFDRRGVLAIAASSWGLVFEAPESKSFEVVNGAAVVEISGPLTQHDDWLWDNYDAIKGRVGEALASSCPAVVIKIDSPGGDAAGCLELSRALRTMAAASGKRMVAHTDAMAASAAYAIACACDAIYVTETGVVGSVGAVSALVDQTGLDAAIGLRFAVVTSGARKADGNPHVPISDGALAEAQSHVDAIAGLFFDLVASTRKTSPAQIRGLEAALFLGSRAVVSGLADGVCTFEQLLADVASGTAGPPGTEAEATMDWKKAMQKAADEGDEEAKKALAALDEKEEPKAEDPPKEEPKAEDPPPPPAKKDEENKDEEARASASAIARVGVLEREVASMKTIRENGERAALLASRTDLTEGQVKLLTAQPLEQMRRTLAAFPATAAPTALTGVRSKVATQGSNQTAASDLRMATNLSPHGEMLDRQMGLSKPGASITKEGDKLVCRTMTPTQARAYVKTMDAREAAQEAVK
jgi:ClpP class serine protease